MSDERRRLWDRLSVQTKLILVFILTGVIIFVVNLYLYINIDSVITRINRIYDSNVAVNAFSDNLDNLQTSLKVYLDTRSTDAMEEYYRHEIAFQDLLGRLEESDMPGDTGIIIENIGNLSRNYLGVSEIAVNARRGNIVEKYKISYQQAVSLYGYINTYLYSLNDELFQHNTRSYSGLVRSFRTLETISMVMLIVVLMIDVFLLALLSKNILDPVQERELMMETHLKDAELKYLQAQINPHFLFNTLNAGAQLAMMEDAERTEEYLQNVASFFRYRIRKGAETSYLKDEIALVDNYIYILNVRFAGEIHFYKDIDEKAVDIEMPGMILQPVVENAVNHGIRGLEREGHICLAVTDMDSYVQISVSDNGIGMTEEQIQGILEGRDVMKDQEQNSNGVGVRNVISRLELYYGSDGLFDIRSDGKDSGTEIIINLPRKTE
ncbi:Histidine kinase-, DNA gyrase B-, and HSP90-like ATPase [Lachnospiraceae bacterium]|nr:Histidine kinase-, DNA gyrase B-, and HSP90-like ATPase [Lachnospiraceae bacterium]